MAAYLVVAESNEIGGSGKPQCVVSKGAGHIEGGWNRISLLKNWQQLDISGFPLDASCLRHINASIR